MSELPCLPSAPYIRTSGTLIEPITQMAPVTFLSASSWNSMA
jgi:hypothetical protein